MDTKQTKSLQAAERGNKRSLVLSEAVRQFNDLGYFDTRLKDVADHLGTTKTNISYHFKSKESLLFEAYSLSCDFAEERLRAAAHEITGLGRILTLMQSLALKYAATLNGQHPPLAVLNDLQALKESEDVEISSRLRDYCRGLRTFIKDGQTDGSVQISSIKSTVFLLLSLQKWIDGWLKSILPGHHDIAIATLMDLLKYGLASEPKRSLRTADPVAPFIAQSENFAFDRTARNKMKLEAFLRVGTRHLNRYGYRQLSINDICSELGVSRGVFYYHFEDKQSLLKDCAARSFGVIENSLKAQSSGASDSLEHLHMALSALYTGHYSDLNPLLRQSALVFLEDKDKAVMKAKTRRITALFAELIASGVAEGSIRHIDLDAIETLLFGTIFSATEQSAKLYGLGKSAIDDEGAESLSASQFLYPLYFGLAKT
jgi:AcrR family transcriptional regulator